MPIIYHVNGDPTDNNLDNLVEETVLATITFDPWVDDGPEHLYGWAIRIDFLDRKSRGAWLERQYRATITDAAHQIITVARANKPEGAPVRSAMDRLCHQLGQWWATPHHGAYSVDWLCGYFAGIRNA